MVTDAECAWFERTRGPDGGGVGRPLAIGNLTRTAGDGGTMDPAADSIHPLAEKPSRL